MPAIHSIRLETLLAKLIEAAKQNGYDEDQAGADQAEKSRRAQDRAERALRTEIAEMEDLIERMGHALEVAEGVIMPCEGEELENCESCQNAGF